MSTAESVILYDSSRWTINDWDKILATYTRLLRSALYFSWKQYPMNGNLRNITKVTQCVKGWFSLEAIPGNVRKKVRVGYQLWEKIKQYTSRYRHRVRKKLSRAIYVRNCLTGLIKCFRQQIIRQMIQIVQVFPLIWKTLAFLKCQPLSRWLSNC